MTAGTLTLIYQNNMANLKEAFEYASQNPDSDFARNLEQLASTGSLNKEAEKYGIDLSPFQPKKTLVNKLGERAKTFASEATLKPSRDILVEGAGTTGLERELTGAESMNRALQSPIRAVGAVGGAIGDVFGAGLEATGLDEPIAQAIQPIVQSEPIQKAIQAFQTLPKETQDVLGAIINTANIPLTGVGAGVVKTGIETGANLLKPVAETTGKLLSKTTPSEARAISNTYKGIMDIVENKKSLLNSFKKSEGSGKDPISIVAENPDYMVRINPEAKTIDASDSITNMRRDIADFSTVRDSLLETADEFLPPISTNKIIQDTLNKFSAKNYSTYLDEGEKAVKDIVTKLQTLRKYNPQTISRIELNNIRKGLDETINSFTDTKLKDRMRADLRKVFKSNLEDSIPESGLLSNLNAKIGDLMDASSFLEKNLNGTKVKGGGLTDLAMKATGASIGATGLGGAFGGIPGAAAGYLMSDFLSKTLIKNAINNPFDRAILEKLKSVRPDVVKRAEDYIKTSQPTSKPTSTGQKELLEKLPSQPNTTPAQKEVKGIKWNSGFVNPGALFEKSPIKINNIVRKMTKDDVRFIEDFQDAYSTKTLTKKMRDDMDRMLGKMRLTAKDGDEMATIGQLLIELFNSKK